MIKVFKLPDLGEGLTESEIVAWHVGPGDTVELNQHIADVETAKAVVELPSPFSGVVTELHQETGVVVHVGEPIVSFEVEDAAGSSGDGAAQPVESEFDGGAPTTREAMLVGYGAAVERGGRPRRRSRTSVLAPADAAPADAARADAARADAELADAELADAAPADAELADAELADAAPADAAPAIAAPAEKPSAPLEGARPAERPRSTPPVRALAKELGVDLTTIQGTGPEGLITRDDVRSHAAGHAADHPVGHVAGRATASVAQSGLQPAAERETRTPIKGVRKLTASAMVQSAFTAPHVTEFLTVDVTPTVELLEALKRNRAFADYRIGILSVVAKALCIAAGRNPSLNTRWDEAAGEIVQYHYVNLGIAAATPRGLIVPNIKDAQNLRLTELATTLAALTETARAGTIGQEALAGGTISITNVGVFGIDAGTPILNPGEAAILAMGSIRRQPWEYQGDIALRSVMTLSLSFDHRLVDGEQGSKFLADIGAILANPGMVLTMV
jgi:2-oxoisovalerate dehydrogenase E2 component (dihydrolipoyl transacylase)